MSRIGKKPVSIPKGVDITTRDRNLEVKGPKGSLSILLSPYVSVNIQDGVVTFDRIDQTREARSHHGLMRNLFFNMVKGVSSGFEKKLDIVGVGFKAEVNGGRLQMNLGYSHPIIFDIPKGIDITVEKQTKLSIKGIDAQLVGQVAAVIRNYRLPDIYKAKGVRYENEFIKVKAGKTGSK